MGVKPKKPKPWMPWRISSLFTTMLGGVATSVIMPLMRPAKPSGIISRPAGIPIRFATLSTTGMKMATTPVLLITAPRVATATISSTSSRVSLLPATFTRASPT
ncbi:hypothetical protein D3C75_608080 [compost metagenome]